MPAPLSILDENDQLWHAVFSFNDTNGKDGVLWSGRDDDPYTRATAACHKSLLAFRKHEGTVSHRLPTCLECIANPRRWNNGRVVW